MNPSLIDTFTEAFGVGGTQWPDYKSEGVDTDSGFVFSLDTMQSYLITKKNRLEEQDSVNTFRIKVHKPGDLPRMEDDKSSWYTIKSNQNDMVTKFISIKGEKVDNKVSKIDPTSYDLRRKCSGILQRNSTRTEEVSIS